MLRKIVVLIFGVTLGLYLNSSSSKLVGLNLFMRPPFITTSDCAGIDVGFPFTYTCGVQTFWYVPGEKRLALAPAILDLFFWSFVPYLIVESWVASKKKK